MERRYETFEEFWPFYVREHSDKLNRTLHVIGTTAAVGCVAGAIFGRRPALLLLAPVVGYGFAWAGHFLVQGNKPATFQYPLWSLRGDFVMWAKTLAGTMDAEVARVMANGIGEPGDSRDPAPTGPGEPTVN